LLEVVVRQEAFFAAVLVFHLVAQTAVAQSARFDVVALAFHLVGQVPEVSISEVEERLVSFVPVLVVEVVLLDEAVLMRMVVEGET
jgi:hypothetical protein